MFDNVPTAPPDAILGLTEAFRRDPNPAKINLGAGVYKDESGTTPVLAAVKEAERRLLAEETSKNYLPITGSAEYGAAVRRLLLGERWDAGSPGRAFTAHAPGGTGALRLAADYLAEHHGRPRVWMSRPTWPNHPQVFAAAGLPTVEYPYFDRATNGLDFDGMLAALSQVAAGEVVLLHGVCHNPSGVDPSAGQWQQLAALLAERRALPLVDIAYQGFAEGVEEDAGAVRELAAALPELMIASSYSKNFGLYNERVGALTVIAADAAAAAAVLSQIKRAARALYSSPPSHGGAVVTRVLGDPELERSWRDEVAGMRRRIRRMRSLFAAELEQRGIRLAPEGNGFVSRQNGMFSFSRLSGDEVERLRDEHAVYMAASGRISVAGLTEENLPRFCDAIAAVRRSR